MKKSDIYEIAIKILGLYLVITVIGLFRDILIYASVLVQSSINAGVTGGINQTSIFLVTVFNFLLVTTVVWFFLFKTKKLTKLICGKEDFMETAKLFTDKQSILEIALILVGLTTIILTVPDFVFRLKNYVYMMQNDLSTVQQDKNFLIISGLKILVGILAVGYSKSISAYLSKDKKSIEKATIE